jgi:hypothetical protein
MKFSVGLTEFEQTNALAICRKMVEEYKTLSKIL